MNCIYTDNAEAIAVLDKLSVQCAANHFVVSLPVIGISVKMFMLLLLNTLTGILICGKICL